MAPRCTPYVTCGGPVDWSFQVRRYQTQTRQHKAIEDSVIRLVLILQNFHHLMVRTEQFIFDQCLADLFQRFFLGCRLTTDATRARAAWDSARSVGLQRVLQDSGIAMNYVHTLLQQRIAAKGAEPSVDLKALQLAVTCASLSFPVFLSRALVLTESESGRRQPVLVVGMQTRCACNSVQAGEAGVLEQNASV